MPQSSTPVPPPTAPPGGNGAGSRIDGRGGTAAPPSPTSRDKRARDVAETLGASSQASWAAKLGRRMLWWGVPVLALVAGFMYVRMRRAQEPARYQTVASRRGDLSVTVTATGTLAALDTVDVGTEVSGVVDVVMADYNDRVRKGQTLAVVNTDQLQAQIQQGEAGLQAAEATAQQTAATVVETRAQTVRAESLLAGRAMTRQEVESAQAALARALAADANAHAQIAASTAALRAQRAVLAKATIRSPIDGVVLQRQVERGRTVAASFQTPVLFVLAADLKRMTLALDIDEADVGEVKAGQAADFTVDAYPERTFAATVRSVRNAAKTVEGVVTYQAVLDVANPDLALRPGMTATAVIKTAQVHDALLVPNAALRFTPTVDSTAVATSGAARAATNTGRQRRVWTLRAGTPTAIAVMIGMTDGQWTEIVGGDLAPGVPLITGVMDPNAATSASDSSATRRPPGPFPIPRGR